MRQRRKAGITLPALGSVDKGDRPKLAKARLAALGAPLAYDVTGDHEGISIVRRDPREGARPLRRQGRRQTQDNIGTPLHPVLRARIATPLTPRLVRIQMLTAPAWLETDKAAAWLEARRQELPGLLTDLDRLLDDERAGVLERYVSNEELLGGLVRVPQWLGERVDTSTHNTAPLPDRVLAGLASHARVTARLDVWYRRVLAVFVHQQLLTEGAPSAAQAALRLGVPGRRRAQAWWEAVSKAAAELVRLGY